MKKTTDKGQLSAAFNVVKAIHRNAGAFAEEYPSGTTFTAVAIEGDVVEVHIQRPDAVHSIVRPCDGRGQDALLGAFRGTASMLEPLSARFAHPHVIPIDTNALRKRHGITD